MSKKSRDEDLSELIVCINSTGIKLAIGAPWPFAFYKQNKTRKKRKETRGEIIVLKYLKARGSKLNATEIRII
jgi:hypothetical protein